MKLKAKWTSFLLLILVFSMVLSGCQNGNIPNDGITDATTDPSNTTDGVSNTNPDVFVNENMIAIRLHPLVAGFDDMLNALLQMPGACDEIWLAVDYRWFLSDLSNEVVRLAPIVKKIKDAGIRVVIEGSTMGHAADGQGNYGYEKYVGSDGYECSSTYCPAGKAFTLQMRSAMKLVAALKPYAIYIDDDFRVDSRGPAAYGCFCNNCIQEFNSTYGTSYTRELLVQAIVTNVDVRAKYIDMNKQHMANLAGAMAEAATKAYKDVYFGVQTVYLTNFLGDDVNPIFEAIHEATGKPVFIRPGAGFYNDHDPMLVFDKVLNNSWADSLLPDYVKVVCHECENANRTVMGKSLGGTVMEASMALAYGCNSLSFSMCQTDNEPVSTREAMWQAFIEHRDYWQGLIDDQTTADGEATGVAGLRLAYFKDMWKLVVKGDSGTKMLWANPNKSAGRDIIDIGLPITYEDDFSSAYLLHPDIVDNLTDDNIKFLLTQNVYTDGMAIQKLIKRGFGDQLPASTLSTFSAEVYTDHEANSRLGSLTGELDNNEVSRCYTFTLKSNCVALAHVAGTNQVSSVLIKTKAGSTWVADGMDLWADMINGVRRSRITAIAQYLGGDKIPARLESDDRIALIVRAEKDGTFVSATLQNVTIGETYPIVKADENVKFTFSRPGFEDVECTSEYKNGEHFVNVPVLSGWQTGTLRVKK